MRGAIAVSADLDGITILSGKDALATYQFNTRTAKHHFCSKCGIYTHHQRRSNPRTSLQSRRVTQLALTSKPSADFSGYYQRHVRAA
jgi:hypothetical protein